VADGIVWRVRIDGAAAILRAFNELPRDANQQLKDGVGELVRELVPKVKAAGAAQGSQAARVSRTTRAYRDRLPSIGAGGARVAGMVYGSEFGMNRRSGWYAARRYADSDGRQYRPHIGQTGYWFFPTVRDNEGHIQAKWLEIADNIAQDWAT
jgi:hypothetical protein